MKKLSKLHMMALALALTVLAGTSVFAANPSEALNEDGHLLSTSDFSTLSGISAEPMKEAELDKVQGKGCGVYDINGRKFEIPCLTLIKVKWPPWPKPDCLSCPIRALTKNILVDVLVFGPEPVPWKDLGQQVLF